MKESASAVPEGKEEAAALKKTRTSECVLQTVFISFVIGTITEYLQNVPCHFVKLTFDPFSNPSQ